MKTADEAKRSSSSLIFFSSPSSHLRHIVVWVCVIKNSACDCPSQLLYFVYFFSLSHRFFDSLKLPFFFLFKSRSYQLFSLCFFPPDSSQLAPKICDHDFTLFFEDAQSSSPGFHCKRSRKIGCDKKSSQEIKGPTSHCVSHDMPWNIKIFLPTRYLGEQFIASPWWKLLNDLPQFKLISFQRCVNSPWRNFRQKEL